MLLSSEGNDKNNICKSRCKKRNAWVICDLRAVGVLKNTFLVLENHKYGIYLGVRIFSNVHMKKLQQLDLFGC